MSGAKVGGGRGGILREAKKTLASGKPDKPTGRELGQAKTRNEYGLTRQQEVFCRAVAAGRTQSQAYLEAYGERAGPAKRTVKASELMAMPHIRARVAQIAREVDEEYTIDTYMLLHEASRLAFSDPARLIDEKTRQIKLPHELDEDTRRAIASFKIDELGRVEYKFWDKNAAIERLFKFKGLFLKDNEQKGGGIAALRDALLGNVVGPSPDGALPDGDDEED